MKKVMLVFGTRPEAIKMCPLVNELKIRSSIKTIVCVTAQHRQMLDQVLATFNVVPDYDLDIMKDRQTLFDITTNILNGIKSVLEGANPDVVLVHGDTSTTFVTALACFYLQIPVGHVEAGLRTYNIYSPYPEEFNRQAVSIISKYNFAPTRLAAEHLIKEGKDPKSIYITGNTVIDALYMVVNKIQSDINLSNELDNSLFNAGYDMCRLRDGKKLVLITGHRRENFGEGFINICNAIRTLVKKYPDVDFVYPMHLNPNVRKPIHEVFGENLSDLGNMFFIEPLEYLSFVHLMEKSSIVLTDSGGIQEEAPSLGKPVLVMRDTTERPEALEAGTVKLVSTDYYKIIEDVSKLIESRSEYEKMSMAINPYGDGNASERIVEFLLKKYETSFNF